MATTKTTAAVETAKKAQEELVTIRIPRTREENGDVYVSVNERSWLIKRGEEVQVPRCVARVLQHREEMLNQAYEFEQELQKKKQ